jgi:transposase InsO family protein
VPAPRAQGSKRAYLFVLVNDYSRLLVHGRWVADQNTRAGQEVLRAAIQRRGVPERLYVDNGAPYANAALELCATKCGTTSATRAGQSRSRPSTESPVAGARSGTGRGRGLPVDRGVGIG